MSQKLYIKIKKQIQSLPLYWKTWFITTLTLIATLIIFFLVFSTFATKFLENNQQKKFDKTVNQIVEEIEKNGINEEKLNQYSLEGYSIFISSNNELIYPNYSNALSTTATESSTLSNVIQIGPATSINSFENGNSSLSTSKRILYKNIWLSLDVYYPVVVNSKEIKSILVDTAPYFVLIGIIVSFGISWIYSRYFVAKINKLNLLVHEMSTSSVSKEYVSQPGDEIQELKNNVYFMYQELQETMVQLNIEMNRVKKLEEDRQIFMRGATHELKTPIMAMMTTLSGMIENIEGYEDQVYHLSLCYNRLQSMSRLVNEMLEVSRLEEAVFSGETDINKLTLDVLEVYEYMIQDKEIELEVSQGKEQKVKIPERALQKIISNLIGNSVKYSPPKKKISILSNNHVWQISNHVNHIEKMDLKSIADPFISYDVEEEEYAKSHGLGLYIVVSLLEQYQYPYHFDLDTETKEFVFQIKMK